MIKPYLRSNKIYKSSQLETSNQYSNKDMIGKEKKVKKGKNKKKNKKKKILQLFNEIEVKNEKTSGFSKYSLGKIEYAQIHKQATKPLKQLQDLTDEELKKYSCPCCGLPSQISGKLESYELCDNPDDFYNCGEGVVLYFSFIKFVIFITFVGTLGISFFGSYISYNYTYELRKICDNLCKDGNYTYYEECRFYSTSANIDSKNSKLFNSFFFKISFVNVKNYRKVYYKMKEGVEKKKDNYYRDNIDPYIEGLGIYIKKLEVGTDTKFESTIINLSFTNFVCLMMMVILNLFYSCFLFNKSNAANYLVYSPSDYAILLTNLDDEYKNFKSILKEKNIEKLGFEPDDNMSEIDIFKKYLKKKYFQKDLKNEKNTLQYYDIKRMDLCYIIDKIVKLQKKAEELDEKIQKIEFDPEIIEKNNEKGNKGDERNFYDYWLGLPFCGEYQESLKNIKNTKKKIENKIDNLIKSSKEDTSIYFCGACFITFNTIKDKEECLSHFQSRCFDFLYEFFFQIGSLFCCWCCCCCCGCCCKNIKFERAPEPEDVIFENLDTSLCTKIINLFKVSLILGLILAGDYAIFIFLYLYQRNLDQTEKTTKLYIISFVITGISTLIELFVEKVIEKLVKKWEKPNTWTDFYKNYNLYLTVSSFINSSVIPIFCEIYSAKSKEYGILISNMLTKFLVNAFVTPIFWTINVNCLLKKFRLCLIKKKNKITYNQNELNKLYELQSMNIAAKYSYIAKTLLMSFLYIPIFPLGLSISLLGFIIGYWIEKYNFAKQYKKPEKLDKKIVDFYLRYFISIFAIYAYGDIIFLNDVYEKNTWSLVNFWVFYGLLLCPYHLLLHIDFLKFKESQIHKKTYDDKYTDFMTDYERANPMTRIEGEMRYLDKLEEKNKIDKKESDRRKKKIKEENQMKNYLKQQGVIQKQNIKGLNNILIWNEEDEENINNKIEPIMEKDDKEGKIIQKNKSKKNKIINIESGTLYQSNYLINQGHTSSIMLNNSKYKK